MSRDDVRRAIDSYKQSEQEIAATYAELPWYQTN
jgi:hypothetical protein